MRAAGAQRGNAGVSLEARDGLGVTVSKANAIGAKPLGEARFGRTPKTPTGRRVRRFPPATTTTPTCNSSHTLELRDSRKKPHFLLGRGWGGLDAPT